MSTFDAPALIHVHMNSFYGFECPWFVAVMNLCGIAKGGTTCASNVAVLLTLHVSCVCHPHTGFDYGNAETTNDDNGAGTMECVYFGSWNAKLHGGWCGGEGDGTPNAGPWGGCCQSVSSSNLAYTTNLLFCGLCESLTHLPFTCSYGRPRKWAVGV